jgi:hypothetical protein
MWSREKLMIPEMIAEMIAETLENGHIQHTAKTMKIRQKHRIRRTRQNHRIRHPKIAEYPQKSLRSVKRSKDASNVGEKDIIREIADPLCIEVPPLSGISRIIRIKIRLAGRRQFISKQRQIRHRKIQQKGSIRVNSSLFLRDPASWRQRKTSEVFGPGRRPNTAS